MQSDEAGSQATVQLIEGRVPATGRHEIQIEVSKKGFDRPLTMIDFAAYFPSEQILRDLGTGRTTLARQNQSTLDQSAVDNVLQRYSSAPNAPFDAGRLTTEVADLANVVRSTIDSPANETAVRRQVYNAIRQLDRSLANQRGNSLAARNTSAKQTVDELGQLGAMLMDTIQIDMASSNRSVADAATAAWQTLQSYAKTSWVTWNGLGVNSEPVDLSANAGQRHWSAIYESGALELDSFLSVNFGQPALVEAEFQVHSAVAAVARQPVQQDAYVYNQNATANFGSADSLTVANTQMGSISIQMESYLSFDLTDYSPNLDSLTLTLQPNDVTGNPTNAIAHVTYGDWSENSITWNNRPMQVGSAIQTWQPVEGVAQTIDLTNVARKVLRQGDVNFDDNVSFWGSEGDMAAFELAIKNPSAYQTKFGPAVSSAAVKERADLNGDGAVNLYDFDPVFYGGTPTYDGFIQSHGVLLADLNLDGMVTSEDLDGLTYQGGGVSYFEGDVDLDDDYDVFDYIRIFVEIDENAQAIPVQANPPRQLDLKLYSPTTSPTLQPVTYPSGELSAAEIEVSGPIVVPTVFQVGDSTTPYKDIFRLTVSGPTTVSLDNREPDGIAGGILPSYQTFNLEADNVYDVSVEHIGHEGTSPVNYSWNADVSPQSFDGEMQGVGAILIDSSPRRCLGLTDQRCQPERRNFTLPTVTITPVNTTSVVQYIDNGVKRDAFVAISNRDDDDQDAVLDIADSKVEGGDDNLVQMTVSPVSLPALQALPGRTILTFDGGVRVWTSPEKTAATKLTSPAILPHNAPSTIYVEAIATAGYSSIRATYELDDMVNLNGGFANPAFHKVTFATWTFDYDADSDNTDGFNYPQNSAWEEHLEDHPYGLGKLVMQNYNTSDPASHFTPTRLRLPAGLDPNDSQIRVRIDFAPGSAAGNIELWTLPKAANRINAAANEGATRFFRAEFISSQNYGTVQMMEELPSTSPALTTTMQSAPIKVLRQMVVQTSSLLQRSSSMGRRSSG
ncbi:MAG: DNRLRE domain-containing protein [Pirellulaceae bacterium]